MLEYCHSKGNVDQNEEKCLKYSGGFLRPGDVVTCARGEAVIRGVKRGCVWYYVERDDILLYWTPTQVKQMIAEETLKVSGHKAIRRKKNAAHQLAFKGEDWDVEKDFAMVEAVNKICDRLSQECEQLNMLGNSSSLLYFLFSTMPSNFG